MGSPAARLRQLLDGPDLQVMPCCFDALSAKMIGQAGFAVTFMSGFAVSAVRLGLPDTGLISYGEIVDQGRNICMATDIPVIGDGDTGYGNPINVRRTIEGYARAGFAAVMIEDQVAPKRCGHTVGKAVVPREDALLRIKAAVDARDEGSDILILARTDAHYTDGLDEAIDRAKAFRDLGADILFVEAPENRAEMERICREVGGAQMANMVEGGTTPILPSAELQEVGYKLAAYPLTLLSASMAAMQRELANFKAGLPASSLMPFDELRRIVGFDDYDRDQQRYGVDRPDIDAP